jgi:glycosyltransferase involved in cell wall biosynthesis
VRVSVVIPTYNRPHLLRRALRSLREQTHPDWEALVVDDGDGRGLAEAVAVRDPRVRALANRGRGQVDARNTALAHTTGDAVALLDDDDWWEDPAHLALVIAALSEGPALVHRHGWIVREEQGIERARESFALGASPETLQRDNTLLTSSLAYPRALHAELGPFDPAVGSYFDWDWILRVLRAGYRLHTLETPGVCYTLHERNASGEVASPTRLRDFQRFTRKHGLTLTIKNHASLLKERSERP